MKITIRNKTDTTADMYVYGEIVSEKWYDNDVDCEELKTLANTMKGGELNMYINSPGGSVFVASSMCSILKRMQDKGIRVKAYVDGIAASAASFLAMQANDIIIYKNSMMMIHKPTSFAGGNSDELRKTAELLDEIENSVMLPLYKNKAKISDDELIAMIADETWLNASDTARVFDVDYVDEERKIAALDKNAFKRYKHVPEDAIKQFTESPKEEASQEVNTVEDKKPVELSEYKKRIKRL